MWNSPDVAGELSEENAEKVQSVPASDRYVEIDHNSPDYQVVMEKLEELTREVRESNEYRQKDLLDHERRLAELEALSDVMQSKRVGVSHVQVFAYGTLAYLAVTFADSVIGQLAISLGKLISRLLGFDAPTS